MYLDEKLFLTRNKFREGKSSGEDTDSVLNDILDLETEGKKNFDLKLEIFSDIITECRDNQSGHVDAKSHEKETVRFVEPMSDGDRKKMLKSRFATKTELKPKWAPIYSIHG
jgi:hypothetical protein